MTGVPRGSPRALCLKKCSHGRALQHRPQKVAEKKLTPTWHPFLPRNRALQHRPQLVDLPGGRGPRWTRGSRPLRHPRTTGTCQRGIIGKGKIQGIGSGGLVAPGVTPPPQPRTICESKALRLSCPLRGDAESHAHHHQAAACPGHCPRGRWSTWRALQRCAPPKRISYSVRRLRLTVSSSIKVNLS